MTIKTPPQNLTAQNRAAPNRPAQIQGPKAPLFVLAAVLIFSWAAAGSDNPSGDIWKKHEANLARNPPKLNLSETAIGQAAKDGRFEDFFRELQALKDQDFKKRLEILRARDSKGNSLFHLMAAAPKQRFEFAGAMLYLFEVLAAHGDYDTVDDWNQSQLTPRDAAAEAGNHAAAEYLVLAEDQVKKLRKEALQDEIKKPLDRDQAMAFVKSELGNKAVLGSFALLDGGLFTSGGLHTGHLGLIMFGFPQLLIGGIACYQAFKVWREMK